MSQTASRIRNQASNSEEIIIDSARGLNFASEEDLYQHFVNEIDLLEQEYLAMRDKTDFTETEQDSMEHYLELTLEDPDEVWQDPDSLGADIPLCHFIRKISDGLSYVASAYVDEDIPTFVFLHFATNKPELVENYKRGELIYDETMRDLDLVTLDGDALEEGDSLAIGLFQAMVTLRTEKDIPKEEFKTYAHLRELTIESADEIWRSTDLSGNVLVTFVRECPDQGVGELYYVVVTQEDEPANVHALLFSFPTNDRTLVDRYCQGENLHAEEVTQESRH